MNKFTILLDSQQLKRYYALYIIELIHKNDYYYFVGNTSDQQNINSNLAFSRLADHLDDTNSSTRNQIYKFIVNNIVAPSKKEERKIDDKIRHKVEEFLVESKILMHVYPLIDFDFPILDNDMHKENVKNVRDFENLIIRIFMEASKKMMNKEKSVDYVRYNDIVFPKIWELIKNDFYV